VYLGIQHMRNQKKIGIVYHEDYNKYDLGSTHPLIGDKPKKTMEYLELKGILKELQTFIPKKATQKDLERVHKKEYIERVKELSKTGGMLSIDTPAPKGIYDIARLATGGSILCAEKLIEDFKCMCNPLGGFHHANIETSSGFCFFNDIAITIEYLREKYHIKRFMIVDTDVHHGNGTQDIYIDDPSVLNISFHQDGHTLYPGTGKIESIGKESAKGFTVNLPLPPGTGTGSYLIAFNQIVPPLIKQFKPEIILFQSGVDTHHSDPLADLELTYQAYFYISNKMKELSENSCNKLLVLFGGGYNSNASIICYYNMMCGLLNNPNYIKEKDSMSHFRVETVIDNISRLKKLLEDYWDFE
jgi:acetoin utilization protein AcuC